MKQLITEAVIFDMDGVITDTMPCHFKAWSQIFAQQGIEVSFEDIYTREGQKGIESVREIFSENGKAFDETLALQLLRDKEVLFKKIFRRKFIRGSRPFIRQLSKRNFRLALVTGSARHEAQKLLPLEIWNLFEVIVCGCDVQNGKPHPEPYLKALKQLKLHPTQAIVIENAPFGIRSAKAAGLCCMAIETSLSSSYLHQADVIVKTYNELINKVKITLGTES